MSQVDIDAVSKHRGRFGFMGSLGMFTLNHPKPASPVIVSQAGESLNALYRIAHRFLVYYKILAEIELKRIRIL